jgi:hypothetical protein
VEQKQTNAESIPNESRARERNIALLAGGWEWRTLILVNALLDNMALKNLLGKARRGRRDDDGL